MSWVVVINDQPLIIRKPLWSTTTKMRLCFTPSFYFPTILKLFRFFGGKSSSHEGLLEDLYQIQWDFCGWPEDSL